VCVSACVCELQIHNFLHVVCLYVHLLSPEAPSSFLSLPTASEGPCQQYYLLIPHSLFVPILRQPLLWHIDPLLGKNLETNKTTAVALQQANIRACTQQ
jgi:hypothetical protein